MGKVNSDKYLKAMAAVGQKWPLMRSGREFSFLTRDIFFAARGFLLASIFRGRSTLGQQPVLEE